MTLAYKTINAGCVQSRKYDPGLWSQAIHAGRPRRPVIFGASGAVKLSWRCHETCGSVVGAAAPECVTSSAQPVPCCDSSQVAPGACARAVWQVPLREVKTACFNFRAIHTAATKAEMQSRRTIVKPRRAAARYQEAAQEATKLVRQSTVMQRREHAQIYFSQAPNRNLPFMRHFAAQKDARASLQARLQDHDQCTRKF